MLFSTMWVGITLFNFFFIYYCKESCSYKNLNSKEFNILVAKFFSKRYTHKNGFYDLEEKSFYAVCSIPKRKSIIFNNPESIYNIHDFYSIEEIILIVHLKTSKFERSI